MSCRILAFFCMFPSRAKIPAKSQHPWPLSCGPLWQPAQRHLCKASLSCMSGNLRVLRGHRLATNTCKTGTSIPPTSTASLTPQSCSLTSLRRGTPHRGSSQSPRQRLAFSSGHYHPRQVSAPFAPSAASHHGSSSCTHLTEHAAYRTTRT